MPRRKSQAKGAVTIERVIERFAKKLAGCRSLRNGPLVVRTVDGAPARFCFDCSEGHVRVLKNTLPATPPRIEMIGKGLQIAGVLAGTKDARRRFFAGGFRIRGDMQYASELGMELGILKQPIGLRAAREGTA